jgi:hypothetical protein
MVAVVRAEERLEVRDERRLALGLDVIQHPDEVVVERVELLPVAEANASPDPLISQRARDGCIVEIPLPRGGSVPVKVTNTWILPTGGFYAFMPSFTGLTHLLGSAR